MANHGAKSGMKMIHGTSPYVPAGILGMKKDGEHFIATALSFH